MHYNTTRFGELEIAEDKVIQFPMGIPGFAHIKRFIILDHRPGSPFRWLQSIDDPDLAFVITDPLQWVPDFHIKVRSKDVACIEPEDGDEFAVSVMVTIQGDPVRVYANLRAPLIINLRTLRGIQHVVLDDRYPIRFRIEQSGNEQRSRPAEPTSAVQVGY